MTALSDLIARLEAAKEGSRELDLDIICALHPEVDRQVQAQLMSEGLWRYTTSLNAALTLVPEDLSWAVKSPGFQSLRKTFLVELENGDYQWCVEGLTRALALCIAALKAREAAR